MATGEPDQGNLIPIREYRTVPRDGPVNSRQSRWYRNTFFWVTIRTVKVATLVERVVGTSWWTSGLTETEPLARCSNNFIKDPYAETIWRAFSDVPS